MIFQERLERRGWGVTKSRRCTDRRTRPTADQRNLLGARVDDGFDVLRDLPLPAARSYRFSIGTTFNPCGPVYSSVGRMMRLFFCCSAMWAVQPAMRAMAKIVVNRSSGMPIV